MKEICWASKDPDHYKNWLRSEDGGHEFLDHWSRRFEYPWVLNMGDFHGGQVTLDAAGGDAPLQRFLAERTGVVFNVDQDAEAIARGAQRWDRANIIRRQDDLTKIGSQGGYFCEGFFDRVVCASVLEHSIDHMDILKELWWVLKPGGRLLLTIDVASYERWNHTIDRFRANKIATMFDLEIPEEPQDILKAVFPEINRIIKGHEFDSSLTCNYCGIVAEKQGDWPSCPKRSDPENVALQVLCIAVDKESK